MAIRIPTGDGVVRNRQTGSGQISTTATEGAMSMGSTIAGIADRWLDQRAESKAQEARNNYQVKVAELQEKYKSKSGKDALGSTAEYEKEFNQINKELSSGLGKRSQGKLGDFGFRVGESARMSIMQHEREQERKYNASNFEGGVTIAQEMVRKDARSWREAAAHLSDTMESGLKSGLWTEEEHQAKRTELTNQFRTEAGKTYYTQDKHSFMKEINDFGFGKAEIEAYKQKYKNDLDAEERERKSLYSEEAKLLFGMRDDMQAQAVANFDTSHFKESAAKLEKMGYKEWAKELNEDAKLYDEVIAFNSVNKNKPLSEIKKEAEGLMVSGELEGSASKLKSNQAIQKEVAKSLKMFSSDPAQYVSKWAQGRDMEEIASSRLSLQQSQGIFPEKGFKILTQDEKKNIKGAWESGDTQQRTELILSSFRYGKHTPQVLSEIGVNNSLALAPLLSDERDVELLVAGVSNKPELLDDTRRGDYKVAAQESEFYQTLVKLQQKFPTNPDLPQKIADIEGAMTGIAARMVDSEAGAKFFDEKFQTVETTDKLIYFPKDFDEDDLEETLDKRKQEIVQKFKSGDEKKDNLSRWAIRDAVWVNTSRGFALADSRSGAYLPGSEIDMIDIDSLAKSVAKSRKAKVSDTVVYTRR